MYFSPSGKPELSDIKKSANTHTFKRGDIISPSVSLPFMPDNGTINSWLAAYVSRVALGRGRSEDEEKPYTATHIMAAAGPLRRPSHVVC